jgi:hypothetical protein
MTENHYHPVSIWWVLGAIPGCLLLLGIAAWILFIG